MDMSKNMLLRKTLAGVIFTMAFLLTPKVFLGSGQGEQATHIPVNMLEGPASQECLWCTPETTPVDCKTKTPSNKDNTLWLNPDQPVPDNTSPCLKQDDDTSDTTPSA